MARVSISSLFSLSRNSYAVAATESVTLRSSALPVMSKASDSGRLSTESPTESGSKERFYWMRNPKTGYWVPENHFGEVDIAELREKLLSKNARSESTR